MDWYQTLCFCWRRSLATLFLCAAGVLAAPLATLCPASLTNDTSALFGDAPQYVIGQSGSIYKACWSEISLPDSATHTNTTAAQLPALSAQLSTLGKSIAISGITNPQAFMDAFGLIRCDAAGNEFLNEENP